MELGIPFPYFRNGSEKGKSLNRKEKGHRPASPPHPGRGLLVVARERWMGPRPTSPPNVGRYRNIPLVSWGEGIIDPDPLLAQELLSQQWEGLEP